MASILGIPFTNRNMEETVTLLSDHIDHENTPFHVVTANPEIVMEAKRDRKFRMLVKQANLVTPDGIGIVIGSKILNQGINERVAGYDMIHALCEKREKEKKKTSIYLLGATDEVVQLANLNLQEMYPHVNVVGFHHGFFEELEEENIVKSIAQHQPDILLAGLGSPKQELFISQHKEVLQTKVLIGCGGTFDVLAGKVERAPEAFQKMHLEWLWRAVKEPKRLKRQLDIPRFLLAVVQEKWSKK